jgi:2-methylisocitrate lyase-like PEP mutase family enzyme
MSGYEDGEQMSFSELIYIVKRILASSTLPLTVDLEAGYSQDPIEIAKYIKTLKQLGVVGINIEDSIVRDKRKLIIADDFAKKLSVIIDQLSKDNVKIFINVRTDSFLLGLENALEETLHRTNLYQSVGADGIFVPCIEKQLDIATVINNTHLPVNVMCMPNLADFSLLKKLGVKRISMGDFLFERVSNYFENSLITILDAQSFRELF